MSQYKIAWLPGDGVGRDVMEAARIVLDSIKLDAEYLPGDIGWEFWINEGNALPQPTLDLLKKHKLGLFGAITSKPKDQAADELTSKLKNKGHVYTSPIVGLRQHFDLDICIRPCRSFPGNPLNFIRRKGDGFEEPRVGAVIFRQNTEGLYAGVEWTNPPEQVRTALGAHPKMARFKKVPGRDLAISMRVFTRGACQRIVTEAFAYAKKFDYKSVTLCEKPNVLRETSGMMRTEAKAAARNYHHIELRETNIDAQMMWLTKNPEDYGVIVSGNMFGDIVSDGFAGLVGGLGFACSANIGRKVAVFEPTHGSAPKYEELSPSIVNPIAMILSACMLPDHVGETANADRIRNAVGAVISEGKRRTYDMLSLPGGPEVIGQGAATTPQMTDEILGKL